MQPARQRGADGTDALIVKAYATSAPKIPSVVPIGDGSKVAEESSTR